MNALMSEYAKTMKSVDAVISASERSGALKLASTIADYLMAEFEKAPTVAEQDVLLRVAEFVEKLMREVC